MLQGTATFRFHAELNDFLPPARRGVPMTRAFRDRVAVKDMIESLGVPHAEIELILVNGRSVRLTYIVRDGDDVTVYPASETPVVKPLLRLRPKPLRTTRFVLDGHLGTLARYLRVLGFDTLYRNDFTDDELARISHDEKRVLLTRDVGLLKRSLVTRGLFLRATDPRRQLVETVRRLDLHRAIRPFRRCARCNALVRPVALRSLRGRVKPAVLDRFRRFRQCSGCGQIYWPGSHYDRMLAMIETLRAITSSPA